MTETAKHPPLADAGEARFRDLVTWWAERVGRHHIPLCDGMEDINNLLGPDAVHHELVHQVVRQVYRANRCGHLGAGISLEQTFTALGQVREALLNSVGADVDQIDLLERLGWFTRQFFGGSAEHAPELQSTPAPVKAPVTTLPRLRA